MNYLNTNLNYPQAETGASGSEYEKYLCCNLAELFYTYSNIKTVDGILLYDESRTC